MRLLICTQVVDRNHPILGFFHRWVEEFAKHCDSVHIICLQEGEHHLPANVEVHSLGKESGSSRLKYLWRFYRYSWRLRHEYDVVFVHMNQVYVLLGAPLWRALGKRVALWYMHGTVSKSLVAAVRLTHVIFSGSAESFRVPTDKLVVTGHGIDTDHFAPHAVHKDIDLITVGRITSSKNLEAMLELLAEVRKVQHATLTIVGAPNTREEIAHQEQLVVAAAALGVGDAVHWYGKATQAELPSLLNRAKVFIHTAKNGSLDKAILEAMACGVPVVSTAGAIVPALTHVLSADSLSNMAKQVSKVLQSGGVPRSEYTYYVQENHSIVSLIPRIIAAYGLSKTSR